VHAAASTGAAPSATLVVNAVVDADEAITAPHVVHVVTGAGVAPTATPVVNAAHLPSASFALPCPHSGSLTAATPPPTRRRIRLDGCLVAGPLRQGRRPLPPALILARCVTCRAPTATTPRTYPFYVGQCQACVEICSSASFRLPRASLFALFLGTRPALANAAWAPASSENPPMGADSLGMGG
jgi:hypothetical protein